MPASSSTLQSCPVSHDDVLAGVTFDCDDPQPVAAFWAQVLGMSTRTAGPGCLLLENDHAGLTLGFLHVTDYRPPTWPSATHPPQVHLDIPVYDGAVAAELMHDLRAVKLPSRGGGCPVYADPAGHPFCLCTNPQNGDQEWPALPGLIGNVVLDCPQPQLLASFYSTLIGFRTRMDDTKAWVVIVPRTGVRPRLAFQGADGQRPGWNDPNHPQQAGLDLVTDNLPAAARQLARLGLRHVVDTTDAGITCLDPAGHVLTIRQPQETVGNMICYRTRLYD